MKIELCRESIKIISESAQDMAFIEDTLKLIKNGDSIELKRKNRDTLHNGEFVDSGVMEYLEANIND